MENQPNNQAVPENSGPNQEPIAEATAPETAPVTPQEPPRDEKGRFVPGYSGNPEGKPIGAKHLTTKLKAYLKELKVKDIKTGELRPVEDALIEKVAHMALNGNERMIQLLWDRIEGKPTQPVEHDVNKEGMAQLTEIFRAMALPPGTVYQIPNGTSTNPGTNPTDGANTGR